MRLATVTAIVLLAAFGGHLLWNERQYLSPPNPAGFVAASGNKSGAISKEASQQTTQDTSSAESSSELSPIEITQSIYDQELDYSARASAAADKTMAQVSHDSFARWRPIYIDPKAILSSGYLSEGAMPPHIRLTLFPDLVIVIDMNNYTVRDRAISAVWEGSIRGAENSTARISINGGEDSPNFVIQLYDYPKAYSIMQSETERDVYIAVEWASNLDGTFD